MGNWLEGKKAVIIGERDGVQVPSIAECLTAAGAKVMFAVTECFV
jgi:betaine reductase